ncbi:MAG TPA: hypothetical protein PLH61_07775 [Bacteroidia bacterium]|nr:hypothetical protein [Bacteroidia bacterium]
MFQPGDKVSFVNEKQEGTVVTVKPNGMIVVEIEDGFPIEVTPRELVIKNSILTAPKEQTKPDASKSNSDKAFIADYVAAFQLKDKIALAFIPDSGQVLSGNITLRLVNGSEDDILAAIYTHKANKRTGLGGVHLLPGTSTEIATIKRNQIIDFEGIIVEALLYRQSESTSRPRLLKSFPFELPTLFQNFPKLQSPFCFTVLQEIHNGEPVIESEEELSGLMEKFKNDSIKIGSQKKASPEAAKKSPDNTLQRFGLSPINHEIDLHIEELINEPAGLSNGEIMQIQLNYFHKTLDKAMLSKAQSIVYIHGVGNGKLKAALREELRNLHIKYKDADFTRYGAGATEVVLR